MSRRRARWPWFAGGVGGLVLLGVVVSVAQGALDQGSLDAGGAGAEAAPGTTAPSATATGPAAPTADSGSALALLATLPVKGKAPLTGYDRVGDFGSAWMDVDHNGCDTRDDVLARDLTGITKQGSCTVLSGTLVSPYSSETIAFRRGVGTSEAVQIDHVVPLANAWVTGAQQLTLTDRESLANDPLNLFAVDGHANEQKSNGDAATWLPSTTAFRCTYIAHQVAVKAKYHLWVAPAEHDAMVRVLDTCPSEAVPAA